MLYPKLMKKKVYRSTIGTFFGYDNRLRPPEGAFTWTENLSTDAYPILTNRKRRGHVQSLEAPAGMLAKEALAIVDGGRLYYNGLATPIEGLREGEKQLVGMGAYICIFPDKLYYNTADPADYGSMEASFNYEGRVEYSMCDAEGADYENVLFSANEPESPGNGDYWADTKSGSLNCYSADTGMWVAVESVFTKLRFTTQGQLSSAFARYDGVEVEGARFDGLNGEKIIYAIGGSAEENERDYMVLISLPMENYVQEKATISIRRKVPDMDYVCQCHNRLWGCFYGNDGSGNLNELYACALGDFKNWNQFLGLSTDSWRASVGSDGVWTGAVSYLGSPVFFKEDRLHRIEVSPVGAHQVGETVCRGVEKGSNKSLAVINETLFYKSRSGVCAYQGGFPESVSAALGDVRYRKATGCGFGNKYYISMEDEKGIAQLFVYDCQKGLWMREDSLRCDFFAGMEDELYCISGRELYAMQGSVGDKEKRLDWAAETGLLSCSEPERKYISRISLRAAMEAESRLAVYIEYDSCGHWEFAGRVRLQKTGTAQLPLRLRRCDHIRLRLEGSGDIKLLSITREESRG